MASVAERERVQAQLVQGLDSRTEGAPSPVNWHAVYISQKPDYVVAVFSSVRAYAAQASIRPCRAERRSP